jgi:hypothetical protein
MSVIKKTFENEDGVKTVEVIKGEKHLIMSLTKYDELTVSFSYGEDKKGFWFQEMFNVNKEDGDFYKAVDGTFASYSGDVFFDTQGANLMLLNEDGNYRFFFMGEHNIAGKEIKCTFFDHSLENDSMKYLFNRLHSGEQKIQQETQDKPLALSKTLQNIVEKK